MRIALGVPILSTLALAGCGAIAAPPSPGFTPASVEARAATEMPPNRHRDVAQQPIYVCDANGVLWAVAVDGKAVRRVGAEGVTLTDIAFDPKNDKMYGVSFTGFYSIDPETGAATYIGSTGLYQANALIFDRAGAAFTAGYGTTDLYSINIKTGAATPIGDNGYWESAGALTFYNEGLVLSGGSVYSPNSLVWLSPQSGRILKTVPLDVEDLFGLASTGENALYGFAGTDFYRIVPQAKDIAKRTVPIVNLDGLNPDVGQIYGAAYDGNFQGP